jgi:hypothetical protein
VLQVSISDWTTAESELRSAAFVTAANVRKARGLARFLAKLEKVPSVVVVSGECDASALALLATATFGYVTDDVSVSVTADVVLWLNLTWSLPHAIGATPAKGLLFGGTLDATALRDSGLARRGDPTSVSLDSPHDALLVRSLRHARRSTAMEAESYDSQLRELL